MGTRRKALKSLISIPFIGGVMSSNELLSYQNGNLVKLNRDYFKELGIRTFINAQIGGGNSELNVNILTAGVIEIKENQIDTTTDVEVRVKAKMNFTGGVDGDAVALQRFLLS